MLLAVTSVKLVCEIALMAMAGQFVLGLLAGPRRDSNPFYRLLQLLGGPFVRITRALAPRRVADRQVPALAFVLLGLAWLLATWIKFRLCLASGVNLCK